MLAGAMQAGEWLAAMRRLRGQRAGRLGGTPPRRRAWTPTCWATRARRSARACCSGSRCSRRCTRSADLLLLDEPFAGLDPSGRDWLRRSGSRRRAPCCSPTTRAPPASGCAPRRRGSRVADGRAVRRRSRAAERACGSSRRTPTPAGWTSCARTAGDIEAVDAGGDRAAALRPAVRRPARAHRWSRWPRSIFAILGVFAYRGNEVGSTWGLTAVLSCRARRLARRRGAGRPSRAAQADMATVAVGGRSGRAGLELALIALAATALTVGFIAFPLLVSPLGSTPMFVPATRSRWTSSPPPLAHLTCAALGGAIGVLCSPPRLNGPPPSRRPRSPPCLCWSRSARSPARSPSPTR